MQSIQAFASSVPIFVRVRAAVLILALIMPAVVSAVEAGYSQAPGLRCGTPQGWCWATVPGLPGTPCFCPGPNGTQILGKLF